MMPKPENPKKSLVVRNGPKSFFCLFLLSSIIQNFFWKPREPIRMPKIDMKAKFAAMNDKVKKARMPSPHELRDGYLNSSFHKSFQQPLTVRTREMDNPEELEQRQVILI